VAGPAASLYRDAQAALQQGNPAAAEIMLERALRIEPRNPHYWYSLAQAVFAQGNHARTEQLCLKVDSLAGNDTALREGNLRLLERARQGTRSR
jgi:predicted Zn-dependent protease